MNALLDGLTQARQAQAERNMRKARKVLASIAAMMAVPGYNSNPWSFQWEESHDMHREVAYLVDLHWGELCQYFADRADPLTKEEVGVVSHVQAVHSMRGYDQDAHWEEYGDGDEL